MKTIAIVACSNPLNIEQKSTINQLKALLEANHFQVIVSPDLFQKQSTVFFPAAEKAESLMRYFEDPAIDYLCDVSGGDMANEILEYLDFNAISQSKATFVGYSDLTTIINSLYTKTGKSSILYQIKNLLAHPTLIPAIPEQLFSKSNTNLFNINYEFIRGNEIEGSVIGGNIRCLLKLAGTEYWPDFKDKVLFLEANSGTVPQMVTYVNQLKQLKVFEQIKGLVLGSFTEMESKKIQPTMSELVLSLTPSTLAICKTEQIGHQADSKALNIGDSIFLKG